MRRALLLAGGTTLGAVQVYPMERLRAQYPMASWTLVAGVSVGSVNGVLFAQDQLPKLREMWLKVDGTSFFMLPNVLHLDEGLFTLRPLRRKMDDLVFRQQISPGTTFVVGVTDYQSDKFRLLAHTSFSSDAALRDGIAASASQPVIMCGWRIEVGENQPHQCFDGGVIHVVPMITDPAAFDAIDVILCEPPRRRGPLPYDKVSKLPGIAARSFEIVTDENVLLDDFRRISEWGNVTQVTVYAPEDFMDEWDASPPTIKHRLDVVGKWMWEHPWDLGEVLAALQLETAAQALPWV